MCDRLYNCCTVCRCKYLNIIYTSFRFVGLHRLNRPTCWFSLRLTDQRNTQSRAMRFVTVCASVVLLTLGTLPVNALPINNPNRTDAGLTPVAQNTTKRSEPQLLGIGSSNNVPNGYGYLQPGIGGNNVPYGYGYLQPGNNNNPSQSGGYISNIMNSIFQVS